MWPSPLVALPSNRPLSPSKASTKSNPTSANWKPDRIHLGSPQERASGDRKPKSPCNLMSTYLKESPCSEPFNLDPDLVRVLKKNLQVIQNLEPIFILHPSVQDSPQGTNPQAKRSLIHIISHLSLYNFRRFPQSEALYSQEYNRIVKEKYGSSSVYLCQRLGFNLAHKCGPVGRNGQPIEYFGCDVGLKDGVDYKVIRNEWPYAIPRDYQHMIVWSRLPLLNPALSKSAADWKLAHERGLGGFVNTSTRLSERLQEFNLRSTPKAKKSSRSLISQSDSDETGPSAGGRDRDREIVEMGLDLEMVKFVRSRWQREDGYEDLMWFLNPVQLQSCPGLPHFHVFVKIQHQGSW